jgi:DNA-binding NtrC family response regulator
MVKNSPSKRTRILIVDDDRGARESLEEILEDDYSVVCLKDGPTALQRIKKESFDLVLLDLIMPDMGGLETLRRIKAHDQLMDVIIISATDRAREATACIKSGAYDYITKPFDPDAILTVIERVLQKRFLEQEVRYLRSEVENRTGMSEIITRSKAVEAILAVIDKVAESSSNVLISGESGTGKELVARAIHSRSARASKPFVGINCAAIPLDLIESELFGHEKGAFTGAFKQSQGKFEYAHQGTIFLDEVSTLKLELQAKLLRFLQEREFTRVGGNHTISVDVRMIAAANTNLLELSQQGAFRTDLYYRLNVVPIVLPPLRQRKEDIEPLALHFLDKFNRQMNKTVVGLSSEVLSLLESYPWPGNIRELENLMERLVVMNSGGGTIQLKDLPYDLLFHDQSLLENDPDPTRCKGLSHARREFERQFIFRMLQNCGWNQTETARFLKIHRNTLINKIKSLNIVVEDEPGHR